MAGLVAGVLALTCDLGTAPVLGPRALGQLRTFAVPLTFVATGFALGAVGAAWRRRVGRLAARAGMLEQELGEQGVRFMAATEAKHELEQRLVEEEMSVSSLYRAAQALETLDAAQLGPAVTETVRRLLGAEGCQLYLLEGGLLRLRAAAGPPPPFTELPLDAGLVGAAIRRGQTTSIRDVAGGAGTDDLAAAPFLLAAPLTGREGALLGCLTVTRLPFLRLTAAAVVRLGAVAGWAGRALENVRVHAEVRASVMTDEVVGAYSYRYYERRLAEEQARAERHDRPLSVLVVRLHAFEDVVPARRGDLGRVVSRVFTRCLRATDLVFRYATEDGLAIILPETAAAEAQLVADRIERELAGFGFRPYRDETRTLQFSVRVLPVRDGLPSAR
jgi:diguanylate cyclase (GGDEF)-like protein